MSKSPNHKLDQFSEENTYFWQMNCRKSGQCLSIEELHICEFVICRLKGLSAFINVATKTHFWVTFQWPWFHQASELFEHIPDSLLLCWLVYVKLRGFLVKRKNLDLSSWQHPVWVLHVSSRWNSLSSCFLCASFTRSLCRWTIFYASLPASALRTKWNCIY